VLLLIILQFDPGLIWSDRAKIVKTAVAFGCPVFMLHHITSSGSGFAGQMEAKRQR